jgi:hypothetical protein
MILPCNNPAFPDTGRSFENRGIRQDFLAGRIITYEPLAKVGIKIPDIFPMGCQTFLKTP